MEFVTSRGVITERRGRRLLRLARKLTDYSHIHALDSTYHPAANAIIGADYSIYRGQEIIIHLSCKDWNRNALQSCGWQLAGEEFNDMQAPSGDYPTDGFQGQSHPVLHTGVVGLLPIFSDMNRGMTGEVGRRSEILKHTNFLREQWSTTTNGVNAR